MEFYSNSEYKKSKIYAFFRTQITINSLKVLSTANNIKTANITNVSRTASIANRTNTDSTTNNYPNTKLDIKRSEEIIENSSMQNL